MGNLTDAERATEPHEAYPRSKRVRHAIWFLREMSRRGSIAFEGTKSALIARTYRLEVQLVKRIKAKFRNELSFQESGK